jgi:RimJ/RimL family protein N-acetyltransferase
MAAAALGDDRAAAEQLIQAALPTDWPLPELHPLLARQAASSEQETEFGIWLIIERAAATVVGDAGFKGPPADRRVEIGYSIIPSHRRRGYATEAARALVGWALERDDIDTVVAACAVDNVASIRTLKRLGFTRTGVEDDEIQWQL